MICYGNVDLGAFEQKVEWIYPLLSITTTRVPAVLIDVFGLRSDTKIAL